MTDKYINKKFVDTKMKYDPLFLFENKKSKFDRWLKKKVGAIQNEESEEEIPEKLSKVPVKSVSAPIP
jgi:hypothetical protein